MVLEGKIWKDGKHWLVAIPALDVMTQGRSRRDAFKMIVDAVTLLVHQKRFKIRVISEEEDRFLVESRDDTALIALMLKQLRAKSGLTLDAMAKKLGVKSKNAYAQYEQGRNQPSLTKIRQFLSAMRFALALDVIPVAR